MNKTLTSEVELLDETRPDRYACIHTEEANMGLSAAQEQILGHFLIAIFQGEVTKDTINLVKLNLNPEEIPMPLKHIVSWACGLMLDDMPYIQHELLDEMRIIAEEQLKKMGELTWPR